MSARSDASLELTSRVDNIIVASQRFMLVESYWDIVCHGELALRGRANCTSVFALNGDASRRHGLNRFDPSKPLQRFEAINYRASVYCSKVFVLSSLLPEAVLRQSICEKAKSLSPLWAIRQVTGFGRPWIQL